MDTFKQIPHSIEAEKGVIAAILVDNNILVEIQEVLNPEYFYNENCKTIYSTLVSMWKKNIDIDVLLLITHLRESNQLEKVGGIEYIENLSGALPSTAGALSYANIIYERFLVRETIRRATSILSEGYTNMDSGELIEFAEKEIFELSKMTRSNDFVDWSELIDESSRTIEKLLQGDGKKITGLHTGYSNLDNMTAGLQKSDLIIIAARPSVGKTAFALNIAKNVAANRNNDKASVAFFSLEMSAHQLFIRLAAMEARVPISNIRTGSLNKDEQLLLTEGFSSLSTLNFHIDDTAGVKIGDIKSKCRKLKIEKGLDVVIIDYLQLITTNKHSDNRQQEVSDISRELKHLARELNVPVIALSQLSRGVEQRTDKKPMMSDIRESGAIEQDADIIMMLYRPEYYGDSIETTDDENNYDGKTIVSLVKHRNGATGDLEFMFQKEINCFIAHSSQY